MLSVCEDYLKTRIETTTLLSTLIGKRFTIVNYDCTVVTYCPIGFPTSITGAQRKENGCYSLQIRVSVTRFGDISPLGQNFKNSLAMSRVTI